jgi:hypothetical protein
MFILRQNRFTRNRFAYKNSPKSIHWNHHLFSFFRHVHTRFFHLKTALFTLFINCFISKPESAFTDYKEAVCVLYENSFFSQTSFVSFLSSRKRPPSNEHRPYCLLTLFPAHWTHSLPFQKSPLLKRCAFLFFPFY